MHVRDHFLFEDENTMVRFEETRNYWPKLKQLYLVIHYTANHSLEKTINLFKERKSSGNTSAHIIIDKDGTVVQMVRFDRKAWHAGKSQWGQLKSLNHFSIGIELVNAGWLTKAEDDKWYDWKHNEVPKEEVVVLSHKNNPSGKFKGWQIYPTKQIDKLIDISLALNEKYEFLDILGHDEISPGRKFDPGPALNLVSLRSLVLGRSE
ncbi:MAG: N-acetylmuramoyl-L-alanine amidase [Bacteroidota bacterium]